MTKEERLAKLTAHFDAARQAYLDALDEVCATGSDSAMNKLQTAEARLRDWQWVEALAQVAAEA